MLIQSQIKKLNLQYRKMKEDAKKLMLSGDLQRYFKKLLQLTEVENEYRKMLSGQMKSAA